MRKNERPNAVFTQGTYKNGFLCNRNSNLIPNVYRTRKHNLYSGLWRRVVLVVVMNTFVRIVDMLESTTSIFGADTSTLKMYTIRSSETTVTTCKSTWSLSPEGKTAVIWLWTTAQNHNVEIFAVRTSNNITTLFRKLKMPVRNSGGMAMLTDLNVSTVPLFLLFLNFHFPRSHEK
jgi:hypothetical protein